VSRARHEYLAVRGGPAGDAEALRRERDLGAELARRGVAVRTVWPDEALATPLVAAHVRWLASTGGEVRCGIPVPTTLFVVDAEVAGVAVDGATTPSIVRGGLVVALHALARRLWTEATPFPVREAPDEVDRAMSDEVLRLLAEGRTDQAIARQLGVSARTVTRLAAAVMARLGARSRFQAGVLAADREQPPRAVGW
jgi:DNA-binding CsgD family transcriptional regulator